MKKLIALALFGFILAGVAMPVLAEERHEWKNLQTGAENMTAGFNEVMANTHAEASKAKTPAGHVGGVAVGGVIAARKTLYRAGAGAIDILTFWIPKKQPLINPEK